MSRFDRFVSPDAPVPSQTWAWNMYGAGVEGMGRDGKPELLPVPEPNDDQLLVRVDAVGMCFSDVKLIKQGGEHPKLYHRDLKTNPTRLGHEATLTVMKIGKNLQGQYHVGQRLALQPDIYDLDGRSTAYGYTIPGGLIQYHVLGPEVLSAGTNGHTSYVLPVEGDLGYAAAALTEPWACVEGAYTQRRRLDPLSGGSMWIVGHADDTTTYGFSKGLGAPATIVLTDVPASVKSRVELEATTRKITVIERNGLSVADYPQLRDLTNGVGFDDIVMLNPQSTVAVSEAAKLIARRGTFNMVGRTPLDKLVQIDVGRIHYDYTAYLGNSGADIAASYGEAHNRADLQSNGVAVFVGAGGPMGQMHVQRAIELSNGPRRIIATDLNTARLDALRESFAPLAAANGKELIFFNPTESKEPLRNFVLRHTDGRGADDVVVSVPVASVMAEAATLMNPDGMLVFFAGVPNGTLAPLDMNLIYLHHAQYTGTSGSRVSDQALVIEKAQAHQLSPNRSVAAIGGLEAATAGMEAMMAGRYAGKIVIFPQLSGLPLIGLSELKDQYPDIAEALAPGDVWTAEAERRLIEKFWDDGAMIYTVTLNPALDRELTVPTIQYDEVLRATEVRIDYGGKGFNVSRALCALGQSSVALGFLGGMTGQRFVEGLPGLGIAVDFVEIQNETRTNISIVTTNRSRYLKVNEPGPEILPIEQAALLEKIKGLAKPGDWWVLSGNLPRGVPAVFYAQMIALVQAAGARVILDTSGEPLKHGCEAGPFLVKPNADEATELTGIAVITPEGAREAVKAIVALGAQNVFMSFGKLGALLFDGQQAWFAAAPRIEERNPIGAGDCAVAGLTWGLSQGLPSAEALRWGVASGSAAASLAGTTVGDYALVSALVERVEVKSLWA